MVVRNYTKAEIGKLVEEHNRVIAQRSTDVMDSYLAGGALYLGARDVFTLIRPQPPARYEAPEEDEEEDSSQTKDGMTMESRWSQVLAPHEFSTLETGRSAVPP